MKIITLTGAGSSYCAQLPTMIGLAKHLASDPLFQFKFKHYSHFIFNSENESHDEDLFAYWSGMAEPDEWKGRDVEVLLQHLRDRLTENTILKTPTSPLPLVPFGTEGNARLEELAMRLAAVGGLQDALKYTPHFHFFNTPHSVNYRSNPFQGNISDLLKIAERFVKESPNPSIALLKATLCHIAKWTGYQQIFGFYNTTPFELWLVENLNFSKELYDPLGIKTGSSAYDILNSPATAAISANIVIHYALDVLRDDWHQLVDKVKHAALLYNNWYQAVRQYDPDTSVRLYTTNWDYMPELVAGVNNWNVRDGFSLPDQGWYYPVAQPGIFSSKSEKDTLDIIKLHGSLDWCTDGIWTIRTKPVDYLTKISHLILEEGVRPLSSRLVRLDRRTEPIDAKKDATELFHHNFQPTPFVSDLVVTNALIHPIDSKGYPRYEPMRSFAMQFEKDLAKTEICWIIGHSLADIYFIQIIEKALFDNQQLKILVQDPYPSESVKKLVNSHNRVFLFTSPFGDTKEINQFLFGSKNNIKVS